MPYGNPTIRINDDRSPMTTYTLTTAEAQDYDSDDDQIVFLLMRSLRNRFGQISGGRKVTTEVLHPDGFVVEQYTAI